MIDRIPILLPSMISSDPRENMQAIPGGQATGFLGLFLQTISAAGKKAGFIGQGKAAICCSAGRYGRLPSPRWRPSRKANPKGDAIRFVLKQEGSGYVSRDAGRESSRYGVLQATARRMGYDGDVRSMSRRDAEKVYDKLWRESGAGALPRDLALVHFDTYVNSPAAAKKMLQSSGGNPEVYLDLRSHRYQRLADVRPERFAKYLKGWMNRIENLRSLVAESNLPLPRGRLSDTGELPLSFPVSSSLPGWQVPDTCHPAPLTRASRRPARERMCFERERSA